MICPSIILFAFLNYYGVQDPETTGRVPEETLVQSKDGSVKNGEHSMRPVSSIIVERHIRRSFVRRYIFHWWDVFSSSSTFLMSCLRGSVRVVFQKKWPQENSVDELPH